MNECDQGSQLCSRSLKAFHTRKLLICFSQPSPGTPSATPAQRVRCPVLGLACGEMLSEVGWPHVCSASVHSRQGQDSFRQMTGGLLEGRSESDPHPASSSCRAERECVTGMAQGHTARFSARVRTFS